MGSSTSRPAETKVFIPRSQVDFSESLLATLESSKETNFTRTEVGERYVEQRVAERLAQLEEDTLKKFESKLEASILNNGSVVDELDKYKNLSTKSVDAKVDTLNKKLSMFFESESTKKEKLAALDKETGVRKQLTKCLIDNKGKPLNCYELIQKFKQAASNEL